MRSFVPSLLIVLSGCPWIGATELQERLDADGDGVQGVAVGGKDCDDDDPRVFPGATERCNGLDDDCNGAADDLAADSSEGSLWFTDADNDGYGDDAAAARRCAPAEGEVDRGGDCDDTDASRTPDTPWFSDADGDGYGAIGATPVLACTAPAGTAPQATDCDDAVPSTHPGAQELCDTVDSDCDGDFDDSVLDTPDPWFADTDQDGFGDPTRSVQSCLPPDDGIPWVLDGTDCDDEANDAYPGAVDPCYDGRDQDCAEDDDDDCDGDGYAATEQGGDDCDDDDPKVFPGVVTTRGVPLPYPTIQSAVDASCPGDTVLIEGGLYRETIHARRPITLQGQGRLFTAVHAEQQGRTLTLDEGGVVQGIKLESGTTKGDGGCVYSVGNHELMLRDVDIINCRADGDGGGLYVDGAQLVIEASDIQVTWGEEGGGAYLANLAPGSRLEGFAVQYTTASAGAGGLWVEDSEVDVSDLRVIWPSGTFAGAMHLEDVEGTWADVEIDTPSAIDHAGVYIDNRSTLQPLTLRRWSITNPVGGDFSVGLSVPHANDLVVSDLTVAGGSGGFGPAASFTGGVVDARNVRLLGTAGGLSVLASALTHDLSVDQFTLWGTGSGAVVSNLDPDTARLSHGIIVGATGDGLITGGSAPVDHTDVFGSTGVDFTDAALIGIDGNTNVDPLFLSVGPSVPPEGLDVRLRPGSPLFGAGSPGRLDADGTQADPGYFGGPGTSATVYDDDDTDGMYDSWERDHGLDPTRDDATEDPDIDGLDNLGEFEAGTWPLVYDTDGDGIDDDTEVAAGTDPLDASSL